MILNIYGSSGSGKTTLIKNLLRNEKMQDFYKSYIDSYDLKKEYEFKTALSLMPLPSYRGAIKEFLEIYGISLESFLSLNSSINNLLKTIFKINDIDDLYQIGLRSIETLSAGELRRFFIIKSLLIKADILVIDEPFSNSDPSLFNIINEAIDYHDNVILLSHLPLDNIINLKTNNCIVNINKVKNIIKNDHKIFK